MPQQPPHLLAFFTAALTQNTNNVQIAAVSDAVYNVRSNNFVLPYDLYLLWAMALGTSWTGARLVTGSLALKGYPHLIAGTRAAGEFTTNPAVLDMRDWAIRLRAGEDLQAQMSNNDGSGTVPGFLGLSVSLNEPNYGNPPKGARWVRFTFTQTLTAGTWPGGVALTAEDQIEGGSYDIWGMRTTCNDAVFSRLILQGFFHRPGVPCFQDAGLVNPSMFDGYLGYMGSFYQYSPPQVEVLGSAAGAETGEVYLLLTHGNSNVLPTLGGNLPPNLNL